MAKIEKPAALLEIEDIINASDAIMIARGDLGVELDAAEVPSVQKKIDISMPKSGKTGCSCHSNVESMIASPTPTRAEATDVAGAVFDGADTVMLSAETAIGEYPVEVVETMANILISAENHINIFLLTALLHWKWSHQYIMPLQRHQLRLRKQLRPRLS